MMFALEKHHDVAKKCLAILSQIFPGLQLKTKLTLTNQQQFDIELKLIDFSVMTHSNSNRIFWINIVTARIRRMGEGNVFSLFTSGGGVPVSHNALQHFPECHGAARGCTLAGGVPWPGGYPGRGVPPPGGYPGWGGTLARGVPCLEGGTLPQGGTLPRGGTQLGQHREYLLHGGRYASCVHVGGLSCLFYIRAKDKTNCCLAAERETFNVICISLFCSILPNASKVGICH